MQNDHTINGVKYVNLMRQIQESIKAKRPRKPTKYFLFYFYQENALMLGFNVFSGFDLIDHLRYSSDHLLSNIKKKTKKKQYRSINDVIPAVYDIFDRRDESLFTHEI